VRALPAPRSRRCRGRPGPSRTLSRQQIL